MDIDAKWNRVTIGHNVEYREIKRFTDIWTNIYGSIYKLVYISSGFGINIYRCANKTE